MKTVFFSAFISLLLLASGFSHGAGGNDALYPSPPPAGSAFVRVLNLTGTSVDVLLNGKSKAQKVSGGHIGGYLYIAPGSRKLNVGETSFELNLKAESAITVIYDGKNLKPITDVYSLDPTKASVAFYNLTESPLSLKTSDGKHAIVDAVAKDQMGTRLVNEIKIGFAIYNGEQNIAKFSEQFLRKGASYSYVALLQGGQVKTLSLANSFDGLQ